MFLGQRLSTDYCAVCAVGMLLTLFGRPHRRADAHRLFGTRRLGWQPPDERAVLDRLVEMFGRDQVRCRSRRFRTVERLADGLAAAREDRPILVAAHCRLQPDAIVARHAFLATAIENNEIRLLDSLAARPKGQRLWNVRLRACDDGWPGAWPVHGARWSLDLTRPLTLFEILQL